MKAYLNNLPTKTWLLLVIPVVVVAYPVVRIVVPAVLQGGRARGRTFGVERDLAVWRKDG